MRTVSNLWSDFNSPLSSLHAWRPILRQLDTYLDESPATESANRTLSSFQPSLDVEERDSGYVISLDVPGFEKDNLDIEMQGNKLLVSGERAPSGEVNKALNRFTERRFGKFQRTIVLPEGVRSDIVEADYRNGVLMIAVPKAEKSLNHKIKIGDQQSDGLITKWFASSDRSQTKELNEKVKLAK